MKKLKIVAIGAACLGFIVIGGTGAYVGAAWLSERYTRSAFEASEAEWQQRRDHFDSRMKLDFQLLTEQPIFTDFARIKNAEPLIRNHMTWDGDTSGSAPEGAAYEEETQLKAFHEKHKLKVTPDSWKALTDDPELDRLKLSWLDDLVSYDHINLATHPSHQAALSRVASLNGIARIGISSSLPLPNYSLWQALALYRFAQLYKAGRAEDAAYLHRHLTYLSFTSNNLIGAVVSVAMLNRERSIEQVVGSYPIPVIDDKRTHALKALSWFWSSVYQSNFAFNRAAGYEEFFTRETGACAAASEIFTSTSGFVSLFDKNVPLEQDFSVQLKRARTFESKLLSMCSLEAYAPFMMPIPDSAEPLLNVRNVLPSQGEPSATLKVFSPVHIPFIRRVIGAMLLTVATPNGFKVYENDEREPASE